MFETARFLARALWERRVPSMRPPRIQALQQRRLRRLVALAAKRSPFYAKRLKDIDPERFELSELEPVSKTAMMENFDAVLTDRRLRYEDLERFVSDPERLGQFYLGRYAVSRTSGTQGVPALIVQDRRALELIFAAQATRGSALPSGPADALGRLLKPARLAIVTIGHGFYPSAAALAYRPAGMDRFVDTRWFKHIDPMEDLTRALEEFQPEVLVAYASVLEALAREGKAGRLRLDRLRQVTNISEPLSPGGRRLITAAFGLTVIDHYSCGECLILSFGCPQGHGMHLQSDWAVLEVVDRDGHPVEPGQAGAKVFMTNLFNTVQPFIRYELPDVVTLSPEPCPCGSPFPLIRQVEGRTDEVVWVQDGNGFRDLHPYVFTHVLESNPAVGWYQLVQRERNRFLLRARPAAGRALVSESLTNFVRHGLHEFGLDQLVRVDVEISDQVGPDPRTGKLKRITSLVGPPAYAGAACAS